MVEKIKKQNEQADDLMEQQDDMIANYKVRYFIIFFSVPVFPHLLTQRFPSDAEQRRRCQIWLKKIILMR